MVPLKCAGRLPRLPAPLRPLLSNLCDSERSMWLITRAQFLQLRTLALETGVTLGLQIAQLRYPNNGESNGKQMENEMEAGNKGKYIIIYFNIL